LRRWKLTPDLTPFARTSLNRLGFTTAVGRTGVSTIVRGGEPGSLVGRTDPDRLEAHPLLVTNSEGRAQLLNVALRLSYFTVGWNCLTGGAALAAAIIASSPALAAFALSAILDSSASVVLVWRFRTERRDPDAAERLERRADRWVAAVMIVVGPYVLMQSLRALIDESHAGQSTFGVALAAIALAVLPWLGRRKLRVASALPSRALRGDGILTSAAAALAALTLAALILNSAVGWWWADPVAALVIGAALATEGLRVAVRHRFS
jgi:divalent metal cation (Fe/Co/Zn/Cd) transporter